MICTKFQYFKILNQLYLTLSKLSHRSPSFQPLCLKEYGNTGSYNHCWWHCKISNGFLLELFSLRKKIMVVIKIYKIMKGVGTICLESSFSHNIRGVSKRNWYLVGSETRKNNSSWLIKLIHETHCHKVFWELLTELDIKGIWQGGQIHQQIPHHPFKDSMTVNFMPYLQVLWEHQVWCFWK